MGWHSADDPVPGNSFFCDAIRTLIVPLVPTFDERAIYTVAGAVEIAGLYETIPPALRIGLPPADPQAGQVRETLGASPIASGGMQGTGSAGAEGGLAPTASSQRPAARRPTEPKPPSS